MIIVTLAGNLGRDAELKAVGDSSVLSFNVAAKSGYGQREQTLWVSCALWGKRGETLAQYLTKGSQVTVIGELSTREYDGKTYLECRVSEVKLQGGGGAQQVPQQNAPHQQAPQSHVHQSQQQAPQAGFNQHDDDIPF